MSSRALGTWKTVAARALDEIEDAHSAVGGVTRGRRYATLQLNHAYATMVSSQFQRFSRDLHSEAADFLAANVQPANFQAALKALLVQGRKLDQGNPNPGNLGSDFARFGLQLWPVSLARDRRTKTRQAALESLNTFRNAIAHQDWTKVTSALRLGQVRSWRRVCDALALTFDRVVGAHLRLLVGTNPW